MQKFGRALALTLVFLLFIPAAAPAGDTFRNIRDKSSAKPPPVIQPRSVFADRDDYLPPSRSAAGYDTTFLGFWDFDAGSGACDPQGWISVDRTSQFGDYFHVDDFAGLGGGDYGRLVPMEGGQSLWCGARPDANNEYLCGYATLPGYGNNWDQVFCTANCLVVTGDVALDFLVTWDAETDYDATQIEFDECDDEWEVFGGGLGVYDGVGSGFASHVLFDSLHTGNVRFRFHFMSDGAWSDQDGIHDTDGGVIIDSLTVRDASGVVLATELFETEAVGDIDAASGNWISCTPPGYGDHAGLMPGGGVYQDADPCVFNASCLWAFFVGSTYEYSCGGPPGQKVIPYENERGQYLHNELWSPMIPVSGSGSVWELRFDIYEDFPLRALVFPIWHVRSIVDGCPGNWMDYGFMYWPSGRGWDEYTYGFGQFIDANASHIQVSVGVRDMCLFWGGVYEDCLCHTHAPLIDNVEVYRIAANGPQWQVRDLDLFQDNFAADGTITGTARADAANDIAPAASPTLQPGDSVSVTVADPENSLDFRVTGDPSSGPAVYCFVRVDGPSAAVTGDPLIDDPRYNVVGTQMINGRTWTHIQMDSSYTSAPSVVADRYNIDLNDNLFVPGDTVWFFFGARSAPPSNKWSYYSTREYDGTNWRSKWLNTDDIAEAAAYSDEFTILPAAGWSRGGDILYVDGMNFRGAQPFFDWAFKSMGIYDQVDRYDIRGPSSAVANHPAGRVVDVDEQLIGVYRKILWDCGNLITAFGDGTGTPDKSDDTGMLYDFLNDLPGTGGVYLCGDDVADEWLNTLTGASAIQLRTTYIDFNVVTWNHATDLGVSPLGVGEPAGFFADGYGPDSLVVFGGCPLINDFDILESQGSSVLQMSYHGKGLTKGAVLSQITNNNQGVDVGFVLSGFSFIYTRDAAPGGVPARSEHMHRILNWLGNLINYPSDGDVPVAYKNQLGQNHPNPFNPTTTIEYSIAQPGHVSLKVYNVAGQLVRTLVDEVQSPDTIQPVTWDGLNNGGKRVSSGVYFYRINARGFTQTKKMVLLK
jgi:hypothetical protein